MDVGFLRRKNGSAAGARMDVIEMGSVASQT